MSSKRIKKGPNDIIIIIMILKRTLLVGVLIKKIFNIVL